MKINLKGKRILIVAEKPSLMREIESAYKTKKRDYIADFTALRGYLVGLKMPEDIDKRYEKWNMGDLPIIPEKWEFKVGAGNSKDVTSIKQKMNDKKYDYIVNACDAGREGQSIFQSIYDFAKCKKPVLRLWASDTTTDTLSSALDNLLDAKSPDLLNMTYSSYLRMRFDWLIGMNLSRYFTIKNKKMIPIGRVMSPTLKLVVDRDREIENFVSKDYFELNAVFSTNDSLEANLLTDNKDAKDRKIRTFDTKKEIENFVSGLGDVLYVIENKENIRNQLAPTLFNLSDLQKEANKAFGMTAQEVLDTCQSLYEKHKLLSYPRTSSVALSTAQADDIVGHIKSASAYLKISPKPDTIEKTKKNKRYFDNKKITDHHAIIPTKVPLTTQKLGPKEKNIYEMVVKRFMAIFLEPKVIKEMTVILKELKTGSLFRMNSNQVLEVGYASIYGEKINQASDLSKIKEGLKINVTEYKPIKKKTSPPSYYTDATLINAMTKARGDDDGFEDESEIIMLDTGIGTEATRAGIIEKLIKKNKKGDSFLYRDKKMIKATDYGKMIIDEVLSGKKVASARLTAEWEKKLRDVEGGVLSPFDFNNEMIKYIKTEIMD